MNKAKRIINLINNMGLRYVLFRASYELKRKLGLLKRKFPTQIQANRKPNLQDWRDSKSAFFFQSNKDIGHFTLSDAALNELQEEFVAYKEGKLKFFNARYVSLGTNYDWLTNPTSQQKYLPLQHWTKVEDLDPIKGDIKFVWEKSRFTFLYLLIRYDYHFKNDQSQIVFSEIEDWIDKNPLNMGPNYKCSQETSLRILNWTFALHYYKHSNNLTESLFDKILDSIYGQLHHIRKNIDFSRIAVRNNHAITETLMLYLSGIFFPQFEITKRWSAIGKKYLEQEIDYQIYPDGSYLQFSHNYHRVVIQLATWACVLGDKSNDPLSDKAKSRIERTLHFLYQHQASDKNGHLPNYGNNDGALFFKLNQCEYRDYRPQLNALYYYFNKTSLYAHGDWNEDLMWYFGIDQAKHIPVERKSQSFDTGGFYILRNEETFLSIRCGTYKDRPAQADNLHLDLWYQGVNLLRDAGTYKYNTDSEELKFFMGTSSHNTVMINGQDQMQKGGRFIWYNWIKEAEGQLRTEKDGQYFEGSIVAFKHLGKNIRHERKVFLSGRDEIQVEVQDQVHNAAGIKTLLWNPHPEFFTKGYTLKVMDENGTEIEPEIEKSWYSSHYGEKEECQQFQYPSENGLFKTIISKG